MTWLNWPNRITIARIALVPPFVICLLYLNAGWNGWRHIGATLFAVMAFSDALDGFLARRLGESTPLGRFLDPVADKLLITCAVILLAIDPTAVPGFQLPGWVAVMAIGKDVLTVLGFGLVYIATGEYFVRPRAWGKACTLVQLVMVGYVLVAPELPLVLQRVWPLFWWLASGLAVIALVDYGRIGNRFVAERHSKTQD